MINTNRADIYNLFTAETFKLIALNKRRRLGYALKYVVKYINCFATALDANISFFNGIKNANNLQALNQ